MRKTLLTTTALVAGLAFAGVAQAEEATGAANVNTQTNLDVQISLDSITATTGDVLQNKQTATSVGNAASQTAKNTGTVEADDTTIFIFSGTATAVGAYNENTQSNQALQDADNVINNNGGPADLTRKNKQFATAVGNSVDSKAVNNGTVDADVDGVLFPIFGTAIGVGAVNLNDQDNFAPQFATNNINADWDVDDNVQEATAAGNAASQTAKQGAGGVTDAWADGPFIGVNTGAGAVSVNDQDNNAAQTAVNSIQGGSGFVDAFDVTNNKQEGLAVGNSLSQKSVNDGAVIVGPSLISDSDAVGALNLNDQLNNSPQLASNNIQADNLVSSNKQVATAAGNAADQVAKQGSTGSTESLTTLNIGDSDALGAGNGSVQVNAASQTSLNFASSDAGNVTNNVQEATSVGNSISQKAVNNGSVLAD